MESCDRYQEMISCLLDGELSDAKEEALRAHMEACPACRQLYSAFAGLSETAKEDLSEPPEALAQGVLFRIRAQSAPKKKTFHWKQLAALAACFAVIVFAASRAVPLFSGMGASDASKMNAALAPGAVSDTMELNGSACGDDGVQEVCPDESSADTAASNDNCANSGFTDGEGLYTLSAPQSAEIFDAGGTSALVLADVDMVYSLLHMLTGISEAGLEAKQSAEPDYTVCIVFENGESEILQLYISGDALLCETGAGGLQQTAVTAAEFAEFLAEKR